MANGGGRVLQVALREPDEPADDDVGTGGAGVGLAEHDYPHDMAPRIEVKGMPDGLVVAVTFFVGAGVEAAVKLAVQVNFEHAAVGDEAAGDDGSGAFETDGGLGAFHGADAGIAVGCPLAAE